jgi:dienelactone hydrolase
MRRVLSMTALLVAAMASAAAFGAPASPIGVDPPADSSNPASLVELTVPSHGVPLLGLLYTAVGTGPHPAAVIYHGFPGFEENLDIAQTLRRAGYDVLVAHYRGSWGVPGNFSFSHAIEDADAQVDWISSPAVVAKYHLDPARIVVIGHSLGGYLALSAAAHHPGVAAAISISGASLGHRFAGLKPADRDRAAAEYAAQRNPIDLLPLAGTSAKALGAEVFDHRDEWDFLKLAPSLGKRPVLLFSASDGSGPSSEALLQALKAAGNARSLHIEIKTDHPYSDHRIALQKDILEWLGAHPH